MQKQVKDKMTYASCKGTLKSKLGFQFFVQEAHAVKLEELSYDSFKGWFFFCCFERLKWINLDFVFKKAQANLKTAAVILRKCMKQL